MHIYIYSKIITKGSNNLNNIIYWWTDVELLFLMIVGDRDIADNQLHIVFTFLAALKYSVI